MFNKDLSYINKDNASLILQRINYVLNNTNTSNSKPSDFIELYSIRDFILSKFF